MDFFKTWVVGVDMSLTDTFILKNIEQLAKQFKPDIIHFVYITNQPDIPQEVLDDIPDLHLPELNHYQSRIEEWLSANFKADIQKKVCVKEGNVVTELLRYASDVNADLFLLGKKQKEMPSSVVKKMARKAPCSLLIVPEEVINSIHATLVPVDFSSYSQLALDMSQAIAEKYRECKLHTLHVYQDATKYLGQVFETKHEIDGILEKRAAINNKLDQYARHQLDEYLENANLSVEVVPHIASIDHSKEVSHAINDWVENNKVDMVIIGAKGKSAGLATLIGSVFEHVYFKAYHHFLLVLKKKGENNGLLKVLLGQKF
ncbi:universal stress protein [Fulvivirga sp. M361]|uniref:universal stress protein n=1 Tax=Fulvivirga sp. M361 TaxID=2594266 RepID=UPI00117A61FF|nr:universal stress protein [Fulvivirga sp. M361]TRX58232.1 universal stress protein [Fulvivirga sp. M361]